MVKQKGSRESQENVDAGSQSFEQDMEIGYEESGPSELTFERLEQKFQDQIMISVKGARSFTFKELKTCTNNFTATANIGSGGYGMYLYDDGYTKNARVGCTQSGCVAAISVAKRVTEEMETEDGNLLGYGIYKGRSDKKVYDTNFVSSPNFERCRSRNTEVPVKREWLEKNGAVANLGSYYVIGLFIWQFFIHQDPLNGEKFITISEVDESGIKPFVDSLSKCPKHGLHNAFKSPERYLLYGDISAKAGHMLAQSEVADFFAIT